MPEDNPNSDENYEKLFADAIDLRHQPTLYSNGVRVSGDTHEFTLDFFNITPNPETNNQVPMSYLLARITMNIETTQKLTNILLAGLQRWEESAGQQIHTAKETPVKESADNESINS